MKEIWFADNLRFLRKSRHLTQEEVGKVVDKGKNAIYQWEQGNTEPTLRDISELATFFNVPVDVLLFFDITKPYPSSMAERLAEDYNELSKEKQDVVANMINALKD